MIRKNHQVDGFHVSSDPDLIDVEHVHRYLSEESYWAKGVPFDVVRRSLAGSLSFGLFREGHQVGFARVITDRATFGYLADVFIDKEWRGRGLSKMLLEAVFAHPDLQGLRRILLTTSDAHGLYRAFGFTSIPEPDKLMQLHNPEVYSVK
jgi:GNAT superfamily N-acetyltransferase